MAELLIQFDASYDVDAISRVVESWLSVQGHEVSLEPGEDYTRIGLVEGTEVGLEPLCRGLDQLLPDIPGVEFAQVLLLPDREAAAPAQGAPRSRPSALAERAATGAPA